MVGRQQKLLDGCGYVAQAWSSVLSSTGWNDSKRHSGGLERPFGHAKPVLLEQAGLELAKEVLRAACRHLRGHAMEEITSTRHHTLLILASMQRGNHKEISFVAAGLQVPSGRKPLEECTRRNSQNPVRITSWSMRTWHVT